MVKRHETPLDPRGRAAAASLFFKNCVHPIAKNNLAIFLCYNIIINLVEKRSDYKCNMQ